jgi:hypothetical protein
MSRDELFEMWEQLASWVGDELMSNGIEGCVLRPVGQMSTSAIELVRHSFKSENYFRRKVAAALAGYIENPDPGLLSELFDEERARDARLPADSIERLYCQSVVEDIVFSAARWCRKEDLKLPAFALLSKIVEATITGEYWNSACYAIATLCYYNQSPELLKRFQAYCTPSGLPLFGKVALPKHPSRPTLEQEKQFAKGLAARNTATLNSIEKLLDEKDQAAVQISMSDENKQWLQKFIQVARDLEPA